MHRLIRDHLEEVLRDSQSGTSATPANVASAGERDYQLHLRQCQECRDEVAAMREHAAVLRGLRTDAEPRPGFYARVMERIDTQRAGSIWNVFSESPFGRRIAIASMALAVLAGVYLVTSEQSQQVNLGSPDQLISATLPNEDQPAIVLGSNAAPDRDAVLVNLVTYNEPITYREQ